MSETALDGLSEADVEFVKKFLRDHGFDLDRLLDEAAAGKPA